MHDKLRHPLLARSALRLTTARGLRHKPAKLLRLPRVGLHLYLGKIALQPQDVLQVLAFASSLANAKPASAFSFAN